MSIISLRIPSFGQFRQDTRLILLSLGIFSLGFFGVQTLLKVLYVLRLGYGLEYVGLFTATSALSYMAMSLPSGALGNRYGVKPMMVLGGVLTTVGMVLLPLSEAVPTWAAYAWPILTQIALTGGWALFSINMVPALMAATTNRTRDDAYALSSMLRSAGTFMGTMVGGLLPLMFAWLLDLNIDGPAPYRWSLLVGAGFGVAGMIPLLRVRVEDPVTVESTSEPHGHFPIALVAAVSLHVILVNGATATCQSFCSAYMDTDLQLSTASIGFLTAAGQFLAVLAPLLMPFLGQRRSHAWTLMVAGAGTAVMLLPLVFIPTWPAAGFGRMGTLAMAALWTPALQVFQMTVIEKHWRSLAYGAVSTGMGFSFGLVSLVGGFIAAAWGYATLFMLGTVLAGTGAIAMWVLRRHLLRTFFVTEKGTATSPEVAQPAPVTTGPRTDSR